MRRRSGRLSRLSLHQLEVLAIAAPIVFLAAVYLFVLGPVHPIFHRWPGFMLLAAVSATAVWRFSRSVFGAFGNLQAEVEDLSEQARRHNQQLMSLHGADLALMRETRVDESLGRIAELGGRLAGACHALLLVPDPRGVDRQFVHPPVAERAPRCAVEAGILNAGGPAGPSTETAPRLLIVPLTHLGSPIGTLYLSRAIDAAPFGPADSEVARMFATHAALVVQNVRLYDEVRALAIEGERQALAREIHDSLAQVLAFVNAKAQAVELYLRSGDVEAARQQMAELSAAAREVYADVREGISALRVETAGKDLGTLVDEYVKQFGESTGMTVSVDWRIAGESLELPPAAEVQLLRIVQEALANVRRHAAARNLRIAAAVEGGAFVLTVEDDGHGFDPDGRSRDGRPRFGLRTMAERAKAVGGTLAVESGPGAGTRVRVAVPLRAHVPIGGET